MAFVPGFEHDIFISYAHVNNSGGEEGAGGWVTQFHRALEAELIQLTGKNLKLWRDRRLDRNQEFDKTIKTAVESSALFLVMTAADAAMRRLMEPNATTTPRQSLCRPASVQ